MFLVRSVKVKLRVWVNIKVRNRIIARDGVRLMLRIPVGYSEYD
jgi:hypothetical protein